MPALAFVVRGRVQGVGFRWQTRSVARRLGLSGWVRNNPDGSVECRASGSERALEELREFLAAGPPGARVDDMAIREISDEAEVSSTFEIRR